MDRFRLKDGQLSRYAFGCGYIQTVTKGSIRTELYGDSACFHVRQYNDDTHERLSWDTFAITELTLARKHYRSLIKGVPSCFTY